LCGRFGEVLRNCIMPEMGAPTPSFMLAMPSRSHALRQFCKSLYGMNAAFSGRCLSVHSIIDWLILMYVNFFALAVCDSACLRTHAASQQMADAKCRPELACPDCTGHRCTFLDDQHEH
ncbi:hypothetical protein, partial [Massilia frigida]|uniref:hypothetical protein n=1 Tax=Massilia frigida TaxID=2609281 RepID=UPI001CB6BAB7